MRLGCGDGVVRFNTYILPVLSALTVLAQNQINNSHDLASPATTLVKCLCLRKRNALLPRWYACGSSDRARLTSDLCEALGTSKILTSEASRLYRCVLSGNQM